MKNTRQKLHHWKFVNLLVPIDFGHVGGRGKYVGIGGVMTNCAMQCFNDIIIAGNLLFRTPEA